MQGRHHALNDTLMLVSVDLKTRAVAMVSVPRDTSDFPFYWGGQAPLTFKINSLVNAIAAGRFGSPDSPMVTLANEIGFLVGVRVDYYAEIDMDGFGKLIDLVGGVDINNPTLLNDPFTCTYIPAGHVHLNGTTALRYVRSRETSSDYARANRQQIVMIALEKKLATPAMLPMLGSLLALAGKSIATNFPLEHRQELRLHRTAPEFDLELRPGAALQLPSRLLAHGRLLDQPAQARRGRRPLRPAIRDRQSLLRRAQRGARALSEPILRPGASHGRGRPSGGPARPIGSGQRDQLHESRP